jgi:hypothetical protein
MKDMYKTKTPLHVQSSSTIQKNESTQVLRPKNVRWSCRSMNIDVDIFGRYLLVVPMAVGLDLEERTQARHIYHVFGRVLVEI